MPISTGQQTLVFNDHILGVYTRSQVADKMRDKLTNSNTLNINTMSRVNRVKNY